MKFDATDIPGVLRVSSDLFVDPRGTFTRIQSKSEFAERGLNAAPEQCSVSYNLKRGTVRGLHFQLAPYNEAKLVVCLAGRMFDAIVDLRKASPTFGKALGLELGGGTGSMMVYVPEGCAHGFQTLEDNTTLLYMISTPYHEAAARGLRWDDPALGLDWPIRDEVFLSDRDRAFPDFATLGSYF